MEILAELPRLAPADRREIFDQLCEMEERGLLRNSTRLQLVYEVARQQLK
jgi:hypothetical protein